MWQRSRNSSTYWKFNSSRLEDPSTPLGRAIPGIRKIMARSGFAGENRKGGDGANGIGFWIAPDTCEPAPLILTTQ